MQRKERKLRKRWIVSSYRAALCSVIMFLCCCTASVERADVSLIYDRSAQAHEATRNPIIVIPGILGSRLYDHETETVVWGSFLGMFADPDTRHGARQIAHPLVRAGDLNDAPIAATPDGVLGKIQVSLLGLPVELNAYHKILLTLGLGGYRDEELGESGAIDYGEGHFTCFQFPYDWRRDISYNAKLLDDFILDKKKYVEQELFQRYGIRRDVKFTIVAHSMGGLLARYYLRYGSQVLREDAPPPELTWAGAKRADRIVLVGTPSAGSIQAFHDLLYDKDIAPVIPTYPAAILGSMPSLYQLLPRTRHGKYVSVFDHQQRFDILDSELWEQHGWGLANPDQDAVLQLLLPGLTSREDRREVALSHLRKSIKRARRFHEALDRPAALPQGIELSLFAGDAINTNTTAYVNPRTGKVDFGGAQPGDGVVPRYSTLMDERVGAEWQPSLVSPVDWSRVTFLANEHLAMTEDPHFVDNVLFEILEWPRKGELDYHPGSPGEDQE